MKNNRVLQFEGNYLHLMARGFGQRKRRGGSPSKLHNKSALISLDWYRFFLLPDAFSGRFVAVLWLSLCYDLRNL